MARLSRLAEEDAGGEGGERGLDHSAFERFARGELLALLKRQPHASFSDILVIAGEKWRLLSASEREGFASEPDHSSPAPQHHADSYAKGCFSLSLSRSLALSLFLSFSLSVCLSVCLSGFHHRSLSLARALFLSLSLALSG